MNPNPYVDPDILEELRRYDEQFKPENDRRPGLDAMPDGACDLEITDAILTRTANTREPILRLGLRTLPGGAVYEWVHLPGRQEAYNRLGADLVTLGFQVSTDVQRHPFSGQLAAIIPQLRGVRFRAVKRTEPPATQGGKPFHKLYVSGRIGGTTAPPALIAPPVASQGGNGPALPRPPAPGAATAFGPTSGDNSFGRNDDDFIPF